MGQVKGTKPLLRVAHGLVSKLGRSLFLHLAMSICNSGAPAGKPTTLFTKRPRSKIADFILLHHLFSSSENTICERGKRTNKRTTQILQPNSVGVSHWIRPLIFVSVALKNTLPPTILSTQSTLSFTAKDGGQETFF